MADSNEQPIQDENQEQLNVEDQPQPENDIIMMNVEGENINSNAQSNINQQPIEQTQNIPSNSDKPHEENNVDKDEELDRIMSEYQKKIFPNENEGNQEQKEDIKEKEEPLEQSNQTNNNLNELNNNSNYMNINTSQPKLVSNPIKSNYITNQPEENQKNYTTDEVKELYIKYNCLPKNNCSSPSKNSSYCCHCCCCCCCLPTYCYDPCEELSKSKSISKNYTGNYNGVLNTYDSPNKIQSYAFTSPSKINEPCQQIDCNTFYKTNQRNSLFDPCNHHCEMILNYCYNNSNIYHRCINQYINCC